MPGTSATQPLKEVLASEARQLSVDSPLGDDQIVRRAGQRQRPLLGETVALHCSDAVLERNPGPLDVPELACVVAQQRVKKRQVGTRTLDFAAPVEFFPHGGIGRVPARQICSGQNWRFAESVADERLELRGRPALAHGLATIELGR